MTFAADLPPWNACTSARRGHDGGWWLVAVCRRGSPGAIRYDYQRGSVAAKRVGCATVVIVAVVVVVVVVVVSGVAGLLAVSANEGFSVN